ncbi:MAG TPA: hypothetical protein PKO06_18185, partial [Candidatus Ozemobacteraceae bacterium]|nr:hypothetical protein [Candidatus Ozemobacteraceae bacterium]
MNWRRWVGSVLVAAGLLLPVPSPAWDCNTTHPSINELAAKLFIVKSQSETFGEKYRSAPIEFRTVFKGTALKKGTFSENASVKETITANFIDWVARGGHDADVPGFVMAFRHFYDPVYEPRHLTWFRRWLNKPDKEDFASEEAFFNSYKYKANEWNINKPEGDKPAKLLFQPKVIKPRIDGITWAVSHPDNDHSWHNGLRAYKAALENDQTALGKLNRE